MTDVAVAPAETDDPVDLDLVSGVAVSDEVAAVADTVIALTRSVGRARARMLAAAAHDVEWSAHVLLKCLSVEGSMRASSLAECLHSDPSTVSRQVAALVRDGLLERRADPDDGRASLLVVTERAREVLAEHDKIRLNFFADMLDDWGADDLRTLAALLQRFTQAYENANTEWIVERIKAASPTTGGNH